MILYFRSKLVTKIENRAPNGVLFSMVGVKGLEPSTSRSQTARASQLRHTPMVFPHEIITYIDSFF